MPLIDKPLHELKKYLGINPRPVDFDAYWDKALQELEATKPNPEFIRVDPLGNCNAELFDLYFTGVGGARIHAKYLRPRNAGPPHPAVLQFHGYSGHSGDWGDKLPFVNEGFSCAALDCRGQGGKSEDNSQLLGNTREGHLIRGLDDAPEKMLFRQIFLDTAQLARVVMAQPEVDPECVGAMGGSQGGALALVCAALEPRIRRVASLYPFLSDYKRIWEMDLAKAAYSDLAFYFRNFDPLHEREEEVFTKLGYIDIQNLVPRIKGDVLMAITLMDTICPPSTQFAAYNKITAKKEAAIFHDHGHEGLPGFNDRVFRFMLDLKKPVA
ncbi:MAG: acetylxylan esterase [Methylacidiphilales bacterium]|nr:acetylxylan esterase [Candidatus Methylacidiphilales bacterium]